MKYNFGILIIVFLFLSDKNFANNSIINPIIQNLISDSKKVAFVSWKRELFFSTFDKAFDTYPQNLIKCGSKVYIYINGSGRLYEVSKKDSGIDFIRIDSTTNFGYNIGSFGFSYDNHIYNLGGYGYWRLNGQLRIFNERAKQWDIVKLNQEIPILTGVAEGMLWYDIVGKKIYTGYYQLRNEAIKNQEFEDTQFVFDVMVLDLEKNEWIKLGTLNNILQSKLQNIKPIAMSPWGSLISIGDKYTLLDFKNNVILSLDEHKEYYQSLSRSSWGKIFYFKDSVLYYGDSNNLDSVVMHYSDFKSTDANLYLESERFSFLKKTSNYLLLAIPIVFLIGLFTFRLNKGREENNDSQYKIKNKDNNVRVVFDQLEIQFLQLLIQNTNEGRPTSVDEQNKVLGLVNKNSEIQKKQRSDTIIGINQKYSLISKSETPIIQKSRTEFDKRTFEYFIDYSRLKEIISFLNNINRLS